MDNQPKSSNFVDILTNAVESTQLLRISVCQVFEQLNDGMKPTDDADGKQKSFIADFHVRLLTVVKHYSDLEKLAAGLPHNLSTPGLGNTSLLTLDSIIDKTPTYHHLLQAYKWTTKAHDHASLALTALNIQTLKRSQNFTLQNAKRPRKIQATSHAATNQHVDGLIHRMDKAFPDMNIKLTRPIGSPAVIQVTLGQTMKALVVLRGLVIEWVSVKGCDEEFCTEMGKLDIWSKSRHDVFRKVLDNTHAAMLHYYSPGTLQEVAVHSFLKWLRSYNTLFSAPCNRCGKFLQDNLPPTWRHHMTYEGYHEGCRS